VVILDGRLANADVEEIHRSLSAVTGLGLLNLVGLEACSEGAVSELRHWIDAGFTIQGATPFMRMLLARHDSEKRRAGEHELRSMTKNGT